MDTLERMVIVRNDPNSSMYGVFRSLMAANVPRCLTYKKKRTKMDKGVLVPKEIVFRERLPYLDRLIKGKLNFSCGFSISQAFATVLVVTF